MDRQTDGQTDIQTSCDSIVRATHMYRAVKTYKHGVQEIELNNNNTRNMIMDARSA